MRRHREFGPGSRNPSKLLQEVLVVGYIGEDELRQHDIATLGPEFDRFGGGFEGRDAVSWVFGLLGAVLGLDL